MCPTVMALADVDLLYFDSEDGYKFEGAVAGDMVGYSWTTGDVDGDGRLNIILGSTATPGGRTDAGTAYVFWDGQGAGEDYDDAG